ncbi:MAG: hypothetical protein PVG32_09105 [Anaerolineales bacterium]|jgi:hypothetical protein
MFKHTSRYYNLKTVKYTTPEGLEVAYKRRRFLPQGEDLPLLLEVKVRQEDRLDLIAARILGDPEQFWRVCDANNAMDPLELTARPGRMIRVSMLQT